MPPRPESRRPSARCARGSDAARPGIARPRPLGPRPRPRSPRRSRPCFFLRGAAEGQQPECGPAAARLAWRRMQADQPGSGQPPPDAMALPRRPQVGDVPVPPRPAGPGGRSRPLGEPRAAHSAHRTGCRRSGTVYRTTPRDAAPGRTRAAPRRARPRTQARSRPPPRRTPRRRTAGSASPAPAAPTRRPAAGITGGAQQHLRGDVASVTLQPAGGQGTREFPGAAPQVENPVPGPSVPADGLGQAGQTAGQRSVRCVLGRPAGRLGVEQVAAPPQSGRQGRLPIPGRSGRRRTCARRS